MPPKFSIRNVLKNQRRLAFGEPSLAHDRGRSIPANVYLERKRFVEITLSFPANELAQFITLHDQDGLVP